MFIRLSHKMKRIAFKHRKINLFLALIVFFALLTIFVYSMPDVANNLLVGILPSWCLILFTQVLADCESSLAFKISVTFLSVIEGILIFALIIDLTVFGKLAIFEW